MSDAAGASGGEPQGAGAPGRAKRINWRIVRLALAVLGLTLSSSVTVAVSPFINGAILDQRVLDVGVRLTDFQVGQIRTAEILTYAFLCIFISARIRTVEPRILGIFGLCLIIAGNFAAIPGTGIWDIVLARMLHALGAACAMSAAAAFIVLAPNPQRVSGALVIPALMVGMAAVLAAGQFAKDGQAQGVFGAVGAAACVALVLVVAFAPKGRGHATETPAFSSMLGALKSPYVIGCAFVFFGSTAVWQSFRQIGLTHGFDPEQVSFIIISVNVLGTLVGASMGLIKAHWVRPAAMIALVCYAVGTISTPLAQDGPSFILAYAFLSFSYLCLTVLIAAIGARLDRTGGLNAAGLGWQSLINATAPYVGGAIVTYGGGYPALFILCVVAACVAIPAFFLATRRLPAAPLSAS